MASACRGEGGGGDGGGGDGGGGEGGGGEGGGGAGDGGAGGGGEGGGEGGRRGGRGRLPQLNLRATLRAKVAKDVGQAAATERHRVLEQGLSHHLLRVRVRVKGER